jgi:hypothetical protein
VADILRLLLIAPALEADSARLVFCQPEAARSADCQLQQCSLAVSSLRMKVCRLIAASTSIRELIGKDGGAVSCLVYNSFLPKIGFLLDRHLE